AGLLERDPSEGRICGDFHAADHAPQPPVHTKYSAPVSSDHAFVPPFSVQFFSCLVPWPGVYVHHSFAMDARFSCWNVKKRCCKAGFGTAFFAISARYATRSCMNWKKSEKRLKLCLTYRYACGNICVQNKLFISFRARARIANVTVIEWRVRSSKLQKSQMFPGARSTV
ncbi:MAG: hypothetical protein Q4G06_05070, partial [Clostridia bacterium]|nr:hypothetical protein [Clostridia bacterium]